MDYRQTSHQYQETSRNRRCVSYSLKQDDAYGRAAPVYSRESRSPENWRKREVVENPRSVNSDPKNMDFCRIVDAISPVIIAEYLEKTYNFLIGSLKEVCFPNLSPMKEEFLMRLIDKKNLNCPSFNHICRGIARDILDVLEHSDFEWIHGFKKDRNQRVLMYQKLYFNRGSSNDREVFKMPQCPLQERLVRNKTEMELIESQLASFRTYYSEPSDADVSDDYEFTSKHGMTKKQRMFKKLLETVGEPFLMSSMQAIIDFMQDDTRNTMEFSDQTADNARLLKILKSFSSKKAVISILPKNCYNLAMKLKAELSRGRQISMKEGRPIGRHKLRNVTVTKLKQSKKKHRNSVSSENGTNCDYDPKQLFLKALSSGKRDTSNERLTRSESSGTLNEKSAPERDRVYNTTRGIDWRRSGEASEAASGAPVEPEPPKQPPQRRSKLIEALSQPIELDKAKGMMEKMGWKGGALGARGEGITEPIMPALDLKAGAGLGHTAVKNQSRRRATERSINLSVAPQSTDFKAAILEEILSVLRARGLRDEVIEIALCEAMSEKEIEMLADISRCINDRQTIPTDTEREKDLCCRILANLNCSKKLELFIDISKDAKQITITRSKITKGKIRRRRWKKSLERQHSDERSDNVCDVRSSDIERLTSELRNRHPNEPKKTLIALAFRITFLKRIEKFVEDCDSVEQNVTFQAKLTKKQCKFLDNLVININRKEKAGYSTRTENVTYSQIVYNLDGSKLKISFPNARTFCLGKECRKQSERKNKQNSDRHSSPEAKSNRNVRSKERGRKFSPDYKYERRKSKHDRRNSPESKYHRKLSPNTECDRRPSPRSRKERSYTPNGGNKSTQEINVQKSRSRKSSTDSKPSRSVSPNFTRRVTIESDSPESECLTPELESYTPEPRSWTPEIRSLTPELNMKMRDKETVLISDDDSIELSNYEDDDDDIVIDDQLSDEENVEDISQNEISDDGQAICVIERAVTQKDDDTIDNESEKNKFAIETDCVVETLDAEICTENEDVLVIDTETLGSETSRELEIATDNEMEERNNDLKDETKTSETEIVEEKHFRKTSTVVTDETPDLSPASSKRSRTSSESSENQAKRIKISQHSKTVLIESDGGISKDKAKEIQLLIARNIDDSDFLPLLKCVGIVNDSLVYLSHSDLSTEWLENVLKKEPGTKLKVKIDEYEKDKEIFNVALKIHDYTNEDPSVLLKRIKRYNPKVNVNNWQVIKTEENEDFTVYIIEIDEVSYKVIQEANFTLFAGIDRVEFSRIWN